jgi:TP901 family phage tail tape measure protein
VALSGRELMITLRARDMATREITRVAAGLRGMNKTRASASGAAINQQRTNLRRLATELGDVNHAYAKTAAEAYSSQRTQARATATQLEMIRKQEYEVKDAYRQVSAENQKQRIQGKLTANQFAKMQLSARLAYEAQVRGLREERIAVSETGAASTRMYHEQIAGARQARIAQQEQIRQQRLAAQQAIHYHENLIKGMHEEADAARMRGRAMMANGSAAIGMGASMAFAGAMGVRAMFSLTKATGDYQTQARRTLTQVDKLHPSLKRLEQMGIQVGNTVPAAFDQMQSSLYDIFSSINVGYKGAHVLLNQFARDAVGGNADIGTATKANLAIMNSYAIGVHATKVSDFMFQLVRKGVGTYDDFAKSIGLILPSAVRLGVNLHQVGATMAFMTRNGLSASRAATSGARAFDALSNPRTVTNLKKMGVNIKNTHGDLAPLPAILDRMMVKMKGMNNLQRSTFLKDAFYGSGGTIQALRFFNMVFKNMGKFKGYIKDMDHSQGTAAKAFDQMSKSYGAQLQMLNNKWHILRVELGTYLLPVVLNLVQQGIKLIDWFRGLSPQMQKNIVLVTAMVAVFLTLGGILVTIAGGILIVAGAIRMMGTTAGEAASKMGTFAGGLTLLAGGMYMAYTATDKTQKAVGIFASAMGGALAGSAFGPWGTAIGGVVGALGGFIAGLHNAQGAAKTAPADYSKLIGTYDSLTGAITGATRATILDQLTRSGTIKNLATYGVTARTAVNAILGQAKAQDTVTSAIKNQVIYYKSLQDQIAKLKASETAPAAGTRAGNNPANAATEQQIARLQAAADAQKNVIDAVRSGIPIAKADLKLARARAVATQDLTGKLRGLPKNVQTQLQLNGVYPTTKGIAKVARMYKLTPKQIQTVISATGVNTTVKAVQNVSKHLKDVGKQRADLHVYTDSIRAGSHTAEGLARDMGTTVKTASEAGPKKAKADLKLFNQTLSSGLTQAKAAAASGGLTVGNNLSSGIERGFAGTGDALAAAAAAAVNQAVAAAKQAAQSKSPSRKMMREGKNLSNGLRVGFEKESAKDRKKTQHALQQWIASLSKTNIKSRAKQVVDDLGKAQQKLKDLISTQKQYEQGVKSSIADFASLSHISNTDVFGNTMPVTFKNLKHGLAKQLQTVKKFKRLLKRLLKAGYNNNIYNQVVQMGPEDGVPYAQALLDASPRQVKKMNKMVDEVSSTANDIAKSSGKQMYKAGIKAAQGLVDGLRKKKKALARVGREMGLAIIKALADILNSKSLQQLANKMDKAQKKHKKHIKATANRLMTADTHASSGDSGGGGEGDNRPPRPGNGGGRHHGGGGGNGGGGGGGTVHHHHNNWHIKTNDQKAKATGKKLAWEYEKRFKKV